VTAARRAERDNPAVAGVASIDRELGARVRIAAGRVPGARRLGAVAGDGLAPAFQALVVGLLLRPGGRRAGLEALAAAGAASTIARAARDALGRPRPGPRADGGFPSRHAAAAVAIARAVGRRHPSLRPWLAVVATVGLAGRVVAAEHDPADLLAGAVIGWSVDGIVHRVGGIVA
jgi:membrane-associated phospholipid phosphatase